MRSIDAIDVPFVHISDATATAVLSRADVELA